MPTGPKEHWDAVYEAKAPDEVSWYQRSPERSLAIIDSVGLATDAAVIDVGAGASSLVDGLLERGFTSVTCLDIAAAALEHSRTRLGDRASGVEWVVGSALGDIPDGPFDLWHDRAVFHFMTSADDQRRYMDRLRAVMKPGGHALISTFAPDGPEKCSGLPVQRHDAASIARELGPGFEVVREEREEHETPWGAAQRFVYALLRRV